VYNFSKLILWKLFKFAVENCFKILKVKFSQKTLPKIFLYFSSFVGRIVVSKI